MSTATRHTRALTHTITHGALYSNAECTFYAHRGLHKHMDKHILLTWLQCNVLSSPKICKITEKIKQRCGSLTKPASHTRTVFSIWLLLRHVLCWNEKYRLKKRQKKKSETKRHFLENAGPFSVPYPHRGSRRGPGQPFTHLSPASPWHPSYLVLISTPYVYFSSFPLFKFDAVLDLGWYTLYKDYMNMRVLPL